MPSLDQKLIERLHDSLKTEEKNGSSSPPTLDQQRLEQHYEQLKTKKNEKKNGNGGQVNGGRGASQEDAPGVSKLTDEDLRNKLRAEEKGQKWEDLLKGYFKEHYPSSSEAVAALLRKLAFYSGNDPLQMERLIRDSGLASEKFDESRGGSTWLRDEIASAIEDTPETYSSKHKKKKKEGGEGATPTHDEIRDRYLPENPNYAYGLGDWWSYGDGIWSLVHELMIKGGLCEVIEAAKPEGIKPTSSLLNSVTELTRVKISVPDNLFDADPNILVVENGVVELSSGLLLPHDPKYYCTTKLSFPYDPEAAAPRWEYFLRSTLDEEIVKFLQEYAGYCLTTDTSHEKALWLVGPPGGGKSTFLEGLTTTLGTRAGVLGLADIQKSRFALAKLEGKTLVTATEQPGGFLTCHPILNAIISGEPVQVERKFRDPYDLAPRAKIAWAMNEIPRVPSGAEGLFRRVEVVPFPEISEKDRDPTLKEDIKGEGPGILNWMLEGLWRLRERGCFEVPSVIRKATAQFRQSNDIPALFVDERCFKGEDLKVQSSVLYKAYREWCLRTGHKPQSKSTIAVDWKRLGFTSYKANGRVFWRGVELDDDDDLDFWHDFEG